MVKKVKTNTIWQFGAFIIGDELLSGKRADRHFPFLRQLLHHKGFELKWVKILPDEPDILIDAFQWSLNRPEGVFSFGGIGATPDDHTRTCLAQAANKPLITHPDAYQLIEQQFEQAAFPYRIKMAELPEGSRLIPNPVNQVPGFSLEQHHCVPGFPDMAHPMVEWVLNTEYTRPETNWIEVSLRIYTAESDLIPLMNQLITDFPDLKISSLPKIATEHQNRQMDLGFKGSKTSVIQAKQAAIHYLEATEFQWEDIQLKFQ